MSDEIIIPNDGHPPFLPKAEYVQINFHLRNYCDEFLQRARHPVFPKYPKNFMFVPKLGMRYFIDKRDMPYFEHWSTAEEFVKSARNGCHLCAMFLPQMMLKIEDFDADILSGGQRAMSISYMHTPLNSQAFYELAFGVKFREQNFVVTTLHMRPIEGQRMDAIPTDFILPIDNITSCSLKIDGNSETKNQWASVCATWIQDCTLNYESCQINIHAGAASSADRPSRLIYAGKAPENTDIRLVNTEDIIENIQWLTLSHCWGPNGIAFKLLGDNLAEFQNCIPSERLSPNFRDAILVTRELSQKLGATLYLWIDALCIVQLSEADWATESVKMGSIYANALCNVVACHGSDSSAGLLHQGDEFLRHLCVVRGNPDTFLSGRWTVGNFENFARDVELSAVFSRAWVHQELHLAQRKLFFSKRQVYWQCSFKTLRQISTDPALSDEEKSELYYGLWHSIIQTHSALKITKDTDRLPSIASIAQAIQSHLPKDSYVAGIFRKYMFWFLLWETKVSQEVIPANNGSPTWSWTSIKGPVDVVFPPVKLKPEVKRLLPLVEFSDIIMIPYIPNFEFGQILPDSASMRAKGILMKLEITVRVDGTQDLEASYKIKTRLIWQNEDIPTGLMPRLDYFEDWSTGVHSVFCLPVVLDEDYEVKLASEHTRIIGLLLQRDQSQSAAYRRCGLFQVVDIRPGSLWDRAATHFKEANVFLQNEYHQDHGKGVLTITLL